MTTNQYEPEVILTELVDEPRVFGREDTLRAFRSGSFTGQVAFNGFVADRETDEAGLKFENSFDRSSKEVTEITIWGDHVDPYVAAILNAYKNEIELPGVE